MNEAQRVVGFFVPAINFFFFICYMLNSFLTYPGRNKPKRTKEILYWINGKDKEENIKKINEYTY